MIYLGINMVKFDVDWEIMTTYENLGIFRSQFYTDLLIFADIQSNSKIFLVYQYLDLTSSLNGKLVFGLSQIFGKLELTFKLPIQKVK